MKSSHIFLLLLLVIAINVAGNIIKAPGQYQTIQNAVNISNSQLFYGFLKEPDCIIETSNCNLITNIKDYAKNEIPSGFSLSQNYPNPFNPATQIDYSVATAGNVKLAIYDLLGREIITLINEYKKPGKYSISFNASSLSSGAYFYSLQAGSYTERRKMILLR